MIRLNLTRRPLITMDLAPSAITTMVLGGPLATVELAARPVGRLQLPVFPATEEEVGLMGAGGFLDGVGGRLHGVNG